MVGNSVAGQVTIVSNATSSAVDVLCRIPFVDLIPEGKYAVCVTFDAQASSADADLEGAFGGGVFTNADVASLYIDGGDTGLSGAVTAVVSYMIHRVG